MVKRLADVLSPTELSALQEFELDLRKTYEVRQVALYGSAARGEATEGSDLDVLIILMNAVTHQMRNEISDIAFETNLRHGTNISVTVFDIETWNSSMMKLSPFHSEVVRDGVALYDTE